MIAILLGSAELVSLRTGEAITLLDVDIQHAQITWSAPTLTTEDIQKHGLEQRLVANWITSWEQHEDRRATLVYDRVLIQTSTTAKAEKPPSGSLFTLTLKPLESA